MRVPISISDRRPVIKTAHWIVITKRMYSIYTQYGSIDDETVQRVVGGARGRAHPNIFSSFWATCPTSPETKRWGQHRFSTAESEQAYQTKHGVVRRVHSRAGARAYQRANRDKRQCTHLYSLLRVSRFKKGQTSYYRWPFEIQSRQRVQSTHYRPGVPHRRRRRHHVAL